MRSHFVECSYKMVQHDLTSYCDVELSYELDVNQSQSHHTSHCFDYLRQGIMCAVDMSMECPRDEPDGSERIHVDGWGISHVCKDRASSHRLLISPTKLQWLTSVGSYLELHD
jgi:hypothetical protein